MEKIREMLPDLQEWLLKRCDQLLRSGGVALAAYPDNFLVPKIVLTAALLDAAHDCYGPRDPKFMRQVQNLRYF
jgi:hypothetical protein